MGIDGAANIRKSFTAFAAPEEAGYVFIDIHT
jgi:hypothetical protein